MALLTTGPDNINFVKYAGYAVIALSGGMLIGMAALPDYMVLAESASDPLHARILGTGICLMGIGTGVVFSRS